MITLILTAIGFLGGVYVGARYSERLRELYYAIIGK